MIDGRGLLVMNSGFFQPPVPALQNSALCFDTVAEAAGLIESENSHAGQFKTLFAAVFGIDNRMALGATLAEPKSTAQVMKAAVAAEQFRFEPGGFFAHCCRDGIVYGGRGCADQHRDDNGRCDELPRRNARRPSDHQFEAT